jgi:hypothetical protein
MKDPRKIIELGLVQGAALTRGIGFIREDDQGVLSYVEVLRLVASLLSAEKVTMGLGDLLGKDLTNVENLLGLSQPNAWFCSSR